MLKALSSRSRWSACLLAATLSACGGKADAGDTNASSGSGSAGGKASSSTGGKPSAPAGGAASSGGATGSGGASGSGPSACAVRDEAPGEPLFSEQEVGEGECQGVTLATVLRQIHELRPDLADVTQLYWPDPERGGDGSYSYAFRTAAGGFAVVLKRGGGDCPAGCTINDYWYFETGAGCEVKELGEAHRDFEHCMKPEQLPRWGIPRAAMPSEICDADLSPQDVSGSYLLTTCGQAIACATSKEGSTASPLPAQLTLTVAQDPADLSLGTVTLGGTGEPLVDGQAFAATFERRKLQVRAEYSNLPAMCIDQWTLALDYDFEGLGSRSFVFNQVHTPDCESAPGDYCKGQLSASFGDAAAQ